MPSADVRLELAAIFDRLTQLEREIDEVEAEMRATGLDVSGPLDLDV
ncbi:MAG: hypothetical protein ABW122_16670 [Ilumatobacteraceae bacterium]